MILSCLISAVAARRLLNKGCQAFLAHVVDTSIGVLEVGDKNFNLYYSHSGNKNFTVFVIKCII